MALTSADKRWLRAMVREEFAELVTELFTSFAAPSAGGYDGATPVPEDEFDEESRGARVHNRRIGFANNRQARGGGNY